MKKQEILDALCYDDSRSPYPLEALYTLEGLRFFTLVTLLNRHKKHISLPDWTKLAANEGEVMRSADPKPERRAPALPHHGHAVTAVRRAELLSIAAQLAAGRVLTPKYIEQCVDNAAHIIAAVDVFLANP
jgi:hypothetical protein